MGVQQIIDQLHRTCAVNRGATVTLVRGEARTVGVPVVPHKTPALQEDVNGTVVEVSCRDFLIGRSGYAFDGVAAEPETSDRIEEIDGESVRTYQPLPFAGEPSQRFADPHFRVWLIHTKQVAVTPVG